MHPPWMRRAPPPSMPSGPRTKPWPARRRSGRRLAGAGKATVGAVSNPRRRSGSPKRRLRRRPRARQAPASAIHERRSPAPAPRWCGSEARAGLRTCRARARIRRWCPGMRRHGRDSVARATYARDTPESANPRWQCDASGETKSLSGWLREPRERGETTPVTPRARVRIVHARFQLQAVGATRPSVPRGRAGNFAFRALR